MYLGAKLEQKETLKASFHRKKHQKCNNRANEVKIKNCTEKDIFALLKKDYYAKRIFSKKKHYLYKNESKKQYINYVIYKLNIYEKRD